MVCTVKYSLLDDVIDIVVINSYFVIVGDCQFDTVILHKNICITNPTWGNVIVAV